jgi:hypothetical protein
MSSGYQKCPVTRNVRLPDMSGYQTCPPVTRNVRLPDMSVRLPDMSGYQKCHSLGIGNAFSKLKKCAFRDELFGGVIRVQMRSAHSELKNRFVTCRHALRLPDMSGYQTCPPATRNVRLPEMSGYQTCPPATRNVRLPDMSSGYQKCPVTRNVRLPDMSGYQTCPPATRNVRL